MESKQSDSALSKTKLDFEVGGLYIVFVTMQKHTVHVSVSG